MTMQNIKFHQLAEIFPLMLGDEFVELKRDIKSNGLMEPIWMHEGQILDGRNRFRACQEVGVIPTFREYTGDSPAAFAWSLNGPRRHLTSSQKAAVAVDLLPHLEAEAKKRQGARNDIEDNIVEKIPQSGEGKSRDKAATMVGTNARYVSDAKKLKEEDIEAFEQVKSGEKTLPQVKRDRVEAAHPEHEAKTEPLRSRGVGIQYAHEAIAALKRIPLNDELRQDAFSVVADWIETNRG